MSDVDRWRETASTLRELAKFTVDAEAKRLLLTLAEDCEQLRPLLPYPTARFG
jgi:hypothetical protein